jgi:hypothetical protein
MAQATVDVAPRPGAYASAGDLAQPGLSMLRSSSLLKNHEMESFRILAGRCLSGAVDLDVIFWPVGWTLTRGG